LHIQNLTNAFEKKHVRVHSNLDAIADKIIEDHFDEILTGKFRMGAPDGWDKKDDKKKNMAIERVHTVGNFLWGKMGGLEEQYGDIDTFLKTIAFGVVKKRKAPYPGAPTKSYVESVHGDVDGCACVLIDDLADSGDSLIQSAQALLSKGAKIVDAAICHGPAEQQALLHIVNATCSVNGQTRVVIDHFITTNTMPRIEEFVKALSPDQERRVTVINSGDGLVRDLHKFRPKPRVLDVV
jgi:phosphoribosylpyrophosphate synthetase